MERVGSSRTCRGVILTGVALVVVYAIAALLLFVPQSGFLFGIYLQAIVPLLMLFVGFVTGRIGGRTFVPLVVALAVHLGLAVYAVGDWSGFDTMMVMFGTTLIATVVGYVVGYALTAHRRKLG